MLWCLQHNLCNEYIDIKLKSDIIDTHFKKLNQIYQSHFKVINDCTLYWVDRKIMRIFK